jgi:UDP-glucose 4-epimerase
VENEGGAGGVSGRHSTILSGPNVYGNTKIIGEQILHDLVQGDKNFPWNVVVLRYFNPVGAHPSGLLGENYKAGKANNLFPAILGAHITKKPIIVFGSDYDTCDGTAVRDYIHVVDLARAHTMSAEKLTGSTGLHVYNVGLGEGKSVMEVIQAFVGAGFEFDWVLGERREGDAAVSYCDNKKIREELGWEPEFGLAEMVSHTISFFNNRR